MNWYRPEEGYEVVDNFWLVQADPGEAWSLGAFLVWNFNKDTRLRLAAGYQHQTSKLTASLSYSYVDFVLDKNWYDSMEQQIAGASLTYALTAKTQIQLAWQSFFTATAYDAPWFNFR